MYEFDIDVDMISAILLFYRTILKNSGYAIFLAEFSMVSKWKGAFEKAGSIVKPYLYAMLYFSFPVLNRRPCGLLKYVAFRELLRRSPGSHLEMFVVNVHTREFNSGSSMGSSAVIEEVKRPAFQLMGATCKKPVQTPNKSLQLLQ